MKMNIFASVKRGELKEVVQVHLTDETSCRKTIEETFGKVNGRLYDWFKENPNFDIQPFTTTQGNFDPSYLNWYMVIDKSVDLLIIVDRSKNE